MYLAMLDFPPGDEIPKFAPRLYANFAVWPGPKLDHLRQTHSLAACNIPANTYVLHGHRGMALTPDVSWPCLPLLRQAKRPHNVG